MPERVSEEPASRNCTAALSQTLAGRLAAGWWL